MLNKQNEAMVNDQQATHHAASYNALHPLNAVEGVLDVMKYYPLVAIGEFHQLQQLHDYFTALLHSPLLPERITDIVVEFGNAHYQEIADRFLLTDQTVDRSDLRCIWRMASGNVLWDAPVYEQFFLTIRAINLSLPSSRRLRVLLGDPPFDMHTVQFPLGRETLQAWFQRDAHFVSVVEKEVLQQGRQALLIAGRYHLLRGLHTAGSRYELNAGSLLTQRYPGSLFVIDPLVLLPRDPLMQRTEFAAWPPQSLALLDNTWLGDTYRPNPLNISKEASTYGTQADAVLYLGPRELLTASRADPALYLEGDYVAELQHLNNIAAQLAQQLGVPSSTDLLATGLAIAQLDPTEINSLYIQQL